MFFDQLGLVSSEEHIPQVNENTEKAKQLLVALESAVTRPRQARQILKHVGAGTAWCNLCICRAGSVVSSSIYEARIKGNPLARW